MSKDSIKSVLYEHSEEIIGVMTGAGISMGFVINELMHMFFALVTVLFSVFISVTVKNWLKNRCQKPKKVK